VIACVDLLLFINLPFRQYTTPANKRTRTDGNQRETVTRSDDSYSNVLDLDTLTRSIAVDSSRSQDICCICTFSLGESSMYEETDEPSKGQRTALELPCRHAFHPECLRELAKTVKGFIQCPNCKKIFGKKRGNQPRGGVMKDRVKSQSLPGFEGVGMIKITYTMCNGIQDEEHPNPGR